MDKDHLTNELITFGKKITMTHAEKARVLSVLDEHMTHHPAILSTGPQVSSPYASIGLWIGRIAVVGALVLVVTGSSLIAMADQALPGDALYGFKIGVNEEIKSFLKPTPAARLAFEAERTQTRLTETQTLIARGDFSAEKQAVIEKSIQKHSAEITKQAEELAAEDPQSYEQVTKKAQASIAQKAKEVEDTLQSAPLDDKIQNEAVLLAARSVTEKAVEPLQTIVDDSENTTLALSTQIVPLSMNMTSTDVSTEIDSHYLDFILDDLMTRIKIVEEELLINHSDSTQDDTSTQTSLSETIVTYDEDSHTTPTLTFDIELLKKYLTDITTTHDKISELQNNEEKSDHYDSLIKLFFETADKAYGALGEKRPTSEMLLPKTNGVILIEPVLSEEATAQPKEAGTITTPEVSKG